MGGNHSKRFVVLLLLTVLLPGMVLAACSDESGDPAIRNEQTGDGEQAPDKT